jgi:hypothetical protein
LGAIAIAQLRDQMRDYSHLLKIFRLAILFDIFLSQRFLKRRRQCI